MKLSISECGKLLSILEGQEAGTTLFHSFEKDSVKVNF